MVKTCYKQEYYTLRQFITSFSLDKEFYDKYSISVEKFNTRGRDLDIIIDFLKDRKEVYTVTFNDYTKLIEVSLILEKTL